MSALGVPLSGRIPAGELAQPGRVLGRLTDIGWGNRLGTLYTWLRALVFSKSRGHRIITFEQANDRLAEGRTASGRPAAIIPPRSASLAEAHPATHEPAPAGPDGS